jgi:hypothetical protein
MEAGVFVKEFMDQRTTITNCDSISGTENIYELINFIFRKAVTWVFLTSFAVHIGCFTTLFFSLDNAWRRRGLKSRKIKDGNEDRTYCSKKSVKSKRQSLIGPNRCSEVVEQCVVEFPLAGSRNICNGRCIVVIAECRRTS